MVRRREDRRRLIQVIQGDENDEIAEPDTRFSVVSLAPLPESSERTFAAKIMFPFLLCA